MNVPLYIVDTFTDRPFSGNPAAVCLMNKARDDAWMGAVAAEMRFSETAFILPDGENWHLRWFTPTMEVDLCGHATLAAAHALWEWSIVPPLESIVFQTRSGPLTCMKRRTWINMDFPSQPAQETTPPADLLAALGISNPLAVRKNQQDFLVEVADEHVVRSLKPAFQRLAAVAARGIIVTCKSVDERHHFISRFFAPSIGIDEDPVTGSAHCCLGPYWGAKLGMTDLIGYQASKRGGVVRMALRGPRVILAGQAVMAVRAQLMAA